MSKRTREQRLITLRNRLEKSLRSNPPPSPRDLAGLSREYRATLLELEELHRPPDSDEIDALLEEG